MSEAITLATRPGGRWRWAAPILVGAAIWLAPHAGFPARSWGLLCVLDEKGAWDCLIWFGGLIMLSTELNRAGFPKAFATAAAGFVDGWPWWWALVALIGVYLYAHYAFASLIAHVTAMFPAFFAVSIAMGAPPLLTALAFGYFSCLNAALTHYGTGPAPIVFGAGYVTQGEWWRIGFVISIVHLAIWLPVGFLWWKAIGLW